MTMGRQVHRVLRQIRRAITRPLLRLAVATVIAGVAACGTGAPQTTPEQYVEDGNATRGRTTIAEYGCGSCHSIPGVRGANGMVGPPLDHWSQRRIIAGEVPNDPARLITWLTVPQSIEPGSAMPNMGVTDGQARDMAAYLYTLH
ncbi:MAG: c-type cytochrome [Gemmatimonadaceae bacterium]